jgi:hypothetical protein
MYFGVELFGLIIVNDAVLPTGIPARPVKLTVLFADELAVNTTSGCATLIVVLAPIKVVTLAVSNTVLRKLVAPDRLTLDVVSVIASLSPVIVDDAMSAPVIVLFAISANVISPLAISADEITFDVILAAVIFESAIFLLFYWLFTLFS